MIICNITVQRVNISNMVDLIALAISILVVIIVMLRRTSAGMAIMAVLAGVMLDQLLAGWVFGLLPNAIFDKSKFIALIIHLIITFLPVVVVLISTKVFKHSKVISLLASLTLGFLIFFFGMKIFSQIPELNVYTKNSGLLHFLEPYQNLILASSAILALIEMSVSHKSSPIKAGKSRKK